jgi:hypothetical protein
MVRKMHTQRQLKLRRRGLKDIALRVNLLHLRSHVQAFQHPRHRSLYSHKKRTSRTYVKVALPCILCRNLALKLASVRMRVISRKPHPSPYKLKIK